MQGDDGPGENLVGAPQPTDAEGKSSALPTATILLPSLSPSPCHPCVPAIPVSLPALTRGSLWAVRCFYNASKGWEQHAIVSMNAEPVPFLPAVKKYYLISNSSQ